jgi:hypothetical protein
MFSIFDKLVIDNNGNIGIGTMFPRCSLDLGARTDGIIIPQSSAALTTTPGMIRLNTNNFRLEVYGSTLQQIQIPPIISGVSSNLLPNVGSTIIVSGTNFEPTLLWAFIGIDGQRYYPIVTYNNSTSVTLTRPSVFPTSNAPYRLFVHSVLTGLDYVSPNIQIQAGAIPSFVTSAGSLGSFVGTVSITPILIQANDADGTISNMTITTGSLPSGLSSVFTAVGSNGTFTISGTPASVVNSTTSTFTITATDNTGLSTAQSFSITINPLVINDFPPAALTGKTTTLSTAYGAGTYTTNSGLNDVGFILADNPSWKAFDKSNAYNNQYHGAWNANPSDTNFVPIYSFSSPYGINTTAFPSASFPNLYMSVFNPSTSTNINISGDWIELTLPVNIVLSSYVYTPRQDDPAACQNRSIGTWYVVGSTNGTTWTVLDYRTGETWPSVANTAARTYTVTTSTAYSRYRLLCMNLSGGGGLLNFHELVYKGYIL